MGDDEPKSAWELAMERFRKQDAVQGTMEQAQRGLLATEEEFRGLEVLLRQSEPQNVE